MRPAPPASSVRRTTTWGALAPECIQNPDYHGGATTAAGYIRESIVDPGAYIVEAYGASRHPMPSYAHLSNADLDALVRMLLSQQ